jgi:putative ATP-binding cassette transporter
VKQFDRAFFRDLWALTKPYWWTSEERWSARGLLVVIIVLNLLMVYISFRVTEWYNTFWNDLQGYRMSQAWHQLLVFAILVTPYIIAAVLQTWYTQMLQIRWRRWLTRHYLGSWMASGTYYQMQILGDGTDNPDQRIADDLNSFTNQTLGLVVGILSSVTTIVAFIAMLWGLSAQVPIPVHGHNIVIPGYLVWAAVVYSVAGTVLTAVVGRPLIGLNFQQERYQADFRFSMVRLRENSESVALYGGEEREKTTFLSRFGALFGNFWQIMRRTRRLNWWVSGYGQAAVIFPILVSLPAYFAKAIQIGSIMQISSAFGQVQGSLSFIVNSYTGLASWHAVVDRLRFFEQAMERVRKLREARNRIVRADGPRLQVTGLTLELPDEQRLLEDLDIELERGGRMIIMGPSGSGKSTLVRALAGIWPFGEGRVELPRQDRTLFLPQKPYLPLGSLREVLLYPFGDADTPDDAIRAALQKAGLPALEPLLEESRPWSHVLSLGEQQRLAFARIFLQRPAWIFMDEATSAIDEPGEGRLYAALENELPEAGIVSVGHRSSLLAFHQSRLVLQGDGHWQFAAIPPAKILVGDGVDRQW